MKRENKIEKPAEYWDVYDKDRRLTDKMHKRGDVMKDGDYHLVVHVCIFNSKNQLLVQQRQPFKHGWPNLWDISVGGSAVAGDTSSKAAERETFEELGLLINLSNVRPHFTAYFDHGFDDYYIIEQDVDISELSLQEEEVQRVKWADRDEVLSMQDEGIMVPYWFLDKLFEIRFFSDVHGDWKSNITMEYAGMNRLASWMSLAEIVKWSFPGLETENLVMEYRDTVIKNIQRKSAICALDGNIVVGCLLFSTKNNMLCFLAVHPEYRRRGIASKMVGQMLTSLDRTKDIVVETFRREDEKGTAPRAFYESMGFVEGELCCFQNGYPEQKFILDGKGEMV